MYILVINSGSSSLKYQLIDMKNESLLCKGLIERIGGAGSRLVHTKDDDKHIVEAPIANHGDAIRIMLDALLNNDYGAIHSIDEIGAVGHRVVHGGEMFSGSVLIDEKVIAAIEECSALAPIHNPPNLMGIVACREIMPNVPNVAVFDTAFHQTMDEIHYLYALPYEYYKNYKIRKYGFHGTSHRFVANRCAELLGKPLSDLKLITVHIGNGSSLCAVKNGKSIDTSMGFTPLCGVVMGTRCGDIDPAIVGFLAEKENKSAAEVVDLLNKKSGLLGISEESNDFRDLYDNMEKGDERAKRAIDLCMLSITKYVGMYAFLMGGVDAIVFTAGVGENNALAREHILQGLEEYGIIVDDALNHSAEKEKVISPPNGKVKVMVIPTNEELMIAEDTMEIVSK